ncbi:azurin [Idiomarina sp. M1R2S28]|uniref:Azurin n=1 Tax=Idiomarina rhizosphaerae TaxID=2961572 RepID=A0A9X2JS93_9GAMM|nr:MULTISPECIES: azurin [Idiomarina]MBL4855672.1 azurin [Idiomarina sp.]MCP1338505.1 azurin [Idiomarina rhizosphaerae]MRJ45116.1 azurin [Idiomarina loihiensis]TDO50178.1 azurin [Idiomarina sp. 017G]UTW32092.1 azurin [Idiomarina loihiensis]
MRYIISALLGSMLFVANAAQANECELSIDSNDNMRFDTKEMSVPASCDEVTVTLHHTGKLDKKVMGHNWVLSEAGDMQSVVQQGMSAGMDNNYVPDSDAVIAATDVVGGGEQTSVTFSTEGMSADTDYKFFCTFPGHSAIMQGSFAIKE